MASEDKISLDMQYEQLNERSRMYTTQLWQIPGLYLALSAWMVERFQLLTDKPNGAASLAMALVTFVIWVFVSQLKFLERRAVRQIQDIEGKPLSTGGTRFFFSYIWYVRALLFLATFWYLCTAIQHIARLAPSQGIAATWAPIAVGVLYIALFLYDYRRSNSTLAGIRAVYQEPSRVVTNTEV